METLYVGNLPFSLAEDGLKTLFEPYGPVTSARIIRDKMSNRSKGYGFVEMETEGADAAITALSGSQLEGRTLRVDRARANQEGGGGGGEGGGGRPQGGQRFGRGGGGGGGGGGRGRRP